MARSLRGVVAAAVLSVLPPLASAQVCRGSSGSEGSSTCREGSSTEALEVPFGLAALWAAQLVPAACDDQERPQECDWRAAGDAWRYVLNNLRLALEAASEQERSWLPLDAALELHGMISQMKEHPGMWHANWPRAVPVARDLLQQLTPWLSSPAALSKLQLPRTNIGTRFPTQGRSISVPTNGDRGSSVTLSNGFAMPVLGFGVWQIPADGTTYRSVLAALEEGYRHIDTAQGYGNEQEVGRAMADSRVPRGEICLVTKLSNPGEYRSARQRFEQQLQTLGVDYIDVYMLHSPGSSMEERQAAWRQMEELYDEGRIKALGVSNFDIPLLQELLGFARVRPVYLQNKYSIYEPGGHGEVSQPDSLMEWLAKEGIVMTGYSIIHPGHGGYLSPMEDPHVKAIAQRHGKTASQVLHRWLLQLGAAVIPRSTKRERIRENAELFDFALPEPEMRLINGLVSMLKSDQSQVSPTWCEDVYGVKQLA